MEFNTYSVQSSILFYYFERSVLSNSTVVILQTVAIGLRMDIQFSLMRLNIAFDDWDAVKAHIKRVRTLCAPLRGPLRLPRSFQLSRLLTV